jgi:hypothetical protein
MKLLDPPVPAMIELLDVGSTTEEVEFWYTASVVALAKMPEDAPVPAMAGLLGVDSTIEEVEF